MMKHILTIFAAAILIFNMTEMKATNASQTKTSDDSDWIEWLVNGDAEGKYGEVPCAYSKVYGKEYNGSIEIPATIETIDGNKVFAVHSQACPDVIDGEEIAHIWQNQFWIKSPKSWSAGDKIKLSFRYKASQKTKVSTQIHKEPGDYLHWDAIGTMSFTTEWKTFSEIVTWPAEADGGKSIAFNLGEENWDKNIDFYFDDLSWMSNEDNEEAPNTGDDPNDDSNNDSNNDAENVVFNETVVDLDFAWGRNMSKWTEAPMGYTPEVRGDVLWSKNPGNGDYMYYIIPGIEKIQKKYNLRSYFYSKRLYRRRL